MQVTDECTYHHHHHHYIVVPFMWETRPNYIVRSCMGWENSWCSSGMKLMGNQISSPYSITRDASMASKHFIFKSSSDMKQWILSFVRWQAQEQASIGEATKITHQPTACYFRAHWRRCKRVIFSTHSFKAIWENKWIRVATSFWTRENSHYGNAPSSIQHF